MSNKFNSLRNRYNVQSTSRNTRSILAAPSTSNQPSTSGIKRTAEVSSSDLASQSNQSSKTGRIVGSVEQVSSAVETNELQDAMGLTGTGKEQASGGASSDGQMSYYIDRPITNFGAKVSTYTKVHKFMTFGIANTTLTAPIDATPSEVGYFMTTHLAEVPWHIPALYLTPSEFALIPDGSHVVNIRVDVVYRGSTIQFETGSTASNLATLNQINDISVAYALNKTGQGSNVNYRSFDAAPQTMVPTSLTRPIYDAVAGTYRGMVRDYYGSNTTDGTFQGDIPKHHVARQTFLYNYWALSSYTATPPNQSNGGWPCLADKIEQMDGKTMVNQVVASMEYSPKMGVIKAPLRTINHGLPSVGNGKNVTVPSMGNRVNMTLARATGAAGVQSSNGYTTSNTELTPTVDNIVDPLLTIYSPIEKSQYMKSGYWGRPDPHVQPSLHIGVQPVPALSTAALLAEDNQFNAWTDTRAYWEVTATMTVKEHTPTAYPHALVANVPFGENVMMTNEVPDAIFNPRNDGATFAGLYTLSSALSTSLSP